jgi:hypothetical protein
VEHVEPLTALTCDKVPLVDFDRLIVDRRGEVPGIPDNLGRPLAQRLEGDVRTKAVSVQIEDGTRTAEIRQQSGEARRTLAGALARERERSADGATRPREPHQRVVLRVVPAQKPELPHPAVDGPVRLEDVELLVVVAMNQKSQALVRQFLQELRVLHDGTDSGVEADATDLVDRRKFRRRPELFPAAHHQHAGHGTPLSLPWMLRQAVSTS